MSDPHASMTLTHEIHGHTTKTFSGLVEDKDETRRTGIYQFQKSNLALVISPLDNHEFTFLMGKH